MVIHFKKQSRFQDFNIYPTMQAHVSNIFPDERTTLTHLQLFLEVSYTSVSTDQYNLGEGTGQHVETTIKTEDLG